MLLIMLSIETLEHYSEDPNGGHLTQQQAADMLKLLREMQTRMQDYTSLEEARLARLKRANRLYKRSNPMPDGVYPDLSTLIDWLIDRSGRKEAATYRGALVEIIQQIDEATPNGIALEGKYSVKGTWLLHIRTLIRYVITKYSGHNNRSSEQSDDYHVSDAIE